MLQRGVGVTQCVVGAETIPESRMVPPEWAIDRGEVQMVGSWISPPEKLAAGNALLSAMYVAGRG